MEKCRKKRNKIDNQALTFLERLGMKERKRGEGERKDKEREKGGRRQEKREGKHFD